MSMAQVEALSVRDHVANAQAARFFYDRYVALRYNDLVRGTSLGGRELDVRRDDGVSSL